MNIDLRFGFFKNGNLKAFYVNFGGMNMSVVDKQALLDKISAIGSTVVENANLVDSVSIITAKIFDEVSALVSANAGDQAQLEAALDELKNAVLAQTPALVAAAGKATEVDGLIPDLPPVV